MTGNIFGTMNSPLERINLFHKYLSGHSKKQLDANVVYIYTRGEKYKKMESRSYELKLHLPDVENIQELECTLTYVKNYKVRNRNVEW